MSFNKCNLIFLLSIICFTATTTTIISADQKQNPKKEVKQNPIINKIIITGNKHVKDEVILNRLPYKKDKEFDKELTSLAINNLYDLGYFRQIQLETDPSIHDASRRTQGERKRDKIDLYVILEEKKLLEKIEFKGNKNIKTKQFFEKLKLDKLTTVDEEGLQQIAKAIEKMYKEENRHLTKVTFKIIPDKESKDKAKAIFEVNEGPSSKISRVYFVGNKHIPSRKLSKMIFTKENWLLNFMDSAGQYNPEAIEMDKHRVEYFYRDHGYLMVKVADIKVQFSKDNKHIDITFYIKEGDKFVIKNIDAKGGEGIFKEKEIIEKVELESGNPYNQSKLLSSINNIKSLWGEKGYIYADIYPQIKPNEKSKTVDITFHSEKGNKMYVNRISVTGNKITQDKVIRRQLVIEEGDLITTRKLSESETNVEYLSFFEKGGVTWRIHKISNELADLELHVRESKTGQLSAGLNYGSDKNTPRRSVKGNITVDKKNLFGRGWNVGGGIQANRYRINKLQANFFDPNLFDTETSGAFSFYRQEEEYEQWSNLSLFDKGTTTYSVRPVEKIWGGDMQLGFLFPDIDKRLRFVLGIGVEDISFNKKRNQDFIVTGRRADLLQPIVNRTFEEGTLNWITLDLVKDKRNHQVYPNHGYRYALGAKVALPMFNEKFSFFKTELETSWYTPIIGEDSLVLMLHGKAGAVATITNPNAKHQKVIPYRELFHMGGQNTVRGFVWGGVGPAWSNGDPLGGRYAVQFNAELMFPLVPDYSMKGHVFYDAGAGWDTPTYGISDTSSIQRNKFDLRQSVGFGLNLMHPMPAKIDWGYKLDRRKKDGESASEFHLSMNYAW